MQSPQEPQDRFEKPSEDRSYPREQEDRPQQENKIKPESEERYPEQEPEERYESHEPEERYPSNDFNPRNGGGEGQNNPRERMPSFDNEYGPDFSN